MVKFLTLSEWLEWIKALHVTEMDLSLERVSEIARRMNLLNPKCPVIIVGGTNGKGSVVAGLEAIYLAAGFKTGAFTTPFLFQYNEQVRINEQALEDSAFCQAFERVSLALGDVKLTLFEFATLAAFDIFQKSELDVWILEVGLGGRFDAVNVLDADVAIVTSIGIDHVEWLGPTREAIAYEKAGIFRSRRPAVCGDFDPPQTLVEYAKKIKSPLFCQAKQFGFEEEKEYWRWWSEKNTLKQLPIPSLALQNMSTVLMAIELLQSKLVVAEIAIIKGLQTVNLPARLQIIPGEITFIYDVSHNPAAAEWLAKKLKTLSCRGKTQAVFSMLADKDMVATLSVMKEVIDEWYVAPLPVPRGASKEVLVESFQQANVQAVQFFSSISEAKKLAVQAANKGDCIVIFGSFHTVKEAFLDHH